MKNVAKKVQFHQLCRTSVFSNVPEQLLLRTAASEPLINHKPITYIVAVKSQSSLLFNVMKRDI